MEANWRCTHTIYVDAIDNAEGANVLVVLPQRYITVCGRVLWIPTLPSLAGQKKNLPTPISLWERLCTKCGMAVGRFFLDPQASIYLGILVFMIDRSSGSTRQIILAFIALIISISQLCGKIHRYLNPQNYSNIMAIRAALGE